jgi:threonine/homoserine/homoserine lactone efflux protein
MERFKIPVWINILSVVGSVFLVYFLAKWNASKQERRSQKEAESRAAETSPRSQEKVPAANMPDHEKPILKKAA